MSRNAIAKHEDVPEWMNELTDRERAFVVQYIVDLSPTDAAVRAGLGKTRKSSTEIASRLRKKPAVAAAISRLMSERAGVTGAAVVNEIARIAFAKATDVMQVENGCLVIKDTKELTEEQRAAIAEISETVGEGGRTIRVKLHDKMDALKTLGRALGIFKEKAEVTHHVEVDMEDAKARLMRMIEGRTRSEPMIEVQPPIRRVAPPAPRIPAPIIDAE